MNSVMSISSCRALPALPFSNGSYGSRPLLTTKKMFAMRRDQSNDREFDYNGRLVDENMIVLRMRIREMRMVEEGEQARKNWMRWEKAWYGEYAALVCVVLGMVQSNIMNVRPSVGIGMAALVTLGVPTYAVIMLLQLLSSIHVG
ncbi:hypothetical protein Droror1_Dr00018949 [Drosera rotundifolia]